MSHPTRATVDGRAYLDLQKLARAQKRPTQQLMQLYALEGFLARLAGSHHVDQLVLKGGVLLAAYEIRRPTRDIDLEGQHLANDATHLLGVVCEIANLSHDDGLAFNTADARAAVIRDGDDDPYSGVRIHLHATLARAELPFHVDISVGDPITPAPRTIEIPRLLDREPVRLKGYPLAMVHAEKIVTAVQRGTANTRWRDFADIYLLAGRHDINAAELTAAVQDVAQYRNVQLRSLALVLYGFAAIGQPAWSAWQRREGVDVPSQLDQVLDRIMAFADPVLAGTATAGLWSAAEMSWSI